MATRCLACGGIYKAIGDDGLPYFHTCAPVTAARVVRNGQVGLVPLRKLLPTDTVRVNRAGQIVAVQVSAVQPDDVRIGDVAVLRPNARDENIEIIGRGPKGAVTRIKAEGAGVDDVSIAVVADPPILDAP